MSCTEAWSREKTILPPKSGSSRPFIIPPHTFCTPSSPTTQMDIPDLAWFKVLLLVAKHSSEDLYSMAGTCKLFEEMLNDPQALNNFRMAAKAGHMESAYIVGLLGLVNPTEGEEDAMEFLCHLSKMKKIDMQACRASIMNRLMRYTISGVVTPPTLAKFTADKNFFLNCDNCEGNREWYFSWDLAGDYSDTVAAWNCCEPYKWKRELYYFQRKLRRETC
ncbi:hypothetical protein L3X38_017815 [Prunus dulcis]|uniref:At2g35280-like TPR domain-containing protein n=1 Tax=Prunus dulcis TaxID=3755 RepID=A0AAD4ZAI7_PRUDU|nr:hypothetical protein L3X38_017815 [Prunus dulcis]